MIQTQHLETLFETAYKSTIAAKSCNGQFNAEQFWQKSDDDWQTFFDACDEFRRQVANDEGQDELDRHYQAELMGTGRY